MPHRMKQLELPVEGQVDPGWPTYEAMNEEALRAADIALGRDVEQLALDCGLSRRELNKQRERTPDDDQGGPASLGHQALYRAALYLDSVRRRFGADRCRPAARLIARACGAAVADEIRAKEIEDDTPRTILRLGIEANRELADYLAQLDTRIADGDLSPRDARALLPELDEVLERAMGAKVALQRRLEAPLHFGRKAD